MTAHADCCTYRCTDAPGCPVHRGPIKKLTLNPADAHLALVEHADDLQVQRGKWAEVLATPTPRKARPPAAKTPGQLFWLVVAAGWLLLTGAVASLMFGL